MGNTADLAMVLKTIIDIDYSLIIDYPTRVSHRGSLSKGVAVQGVLFQIKCKVDWKEEIR